VPEGAADLDALRRALGYRRWNLLAFSADGVLGLTYMRLYPKRIRSAILDSPVSPQYLGDLDGRRGVHALLERVFAGCAANAACNDRYPDIRGVFYDLVHGLQANPQVVSVTVTLDAPDIPDITPRPVRVKVDGLEFYLAATDELAPWTIQDMLSNIWRSAHGALEAVYRERLRREPLRFNEDSGFARGKTESYLCRDVIGFITRRDMRQAALDIPELALYFLDPDYGLHPAHGVPFGPAGCRIWDVGRADAAQHRPVSSRIPTLVLAGEYDTAVPPSITRQIPPTLRNSFFYELPGVHAPSSPTSTRRAHVPGRSPRSSSAALDGAPTRAAWRPSRPST
jgi:pimeloyl-ACP methyl ester carboxylesterase